MDSTSTVVDQIRRGLVVLLGTVGLASVASAPGLASSPVTFAVSQDDVLALVDDTGLLTVDVPATWTDVSTAPVLFPDGANNAQIVASPDQAAFYDTYTTPGLIYTGLGYNSDSVAGLTNQYDFSADCTDSGVETYIDSYFVGSMQTWSGCGGTESQVVTLFASPRDRSFSAGLLIQLPTSADDASLETILSSFYVVSPTTAVLVDDTSSISVTVPIGWADVTTVAEPDEAGQSNALIVAAPDRARFAAGTGAGLRFGTEPYSADLVGMLARNAPPNCIAGPVTEYDDGSFAGLVQEFPDCGGLHVQVVVANSPDVSDRSVTVLVATTPDDDVTADIIFATFNFAAPSGTPAAAVTIPAVTVPTMPGSTGPVASATTVPVTTAPTVPVATAPTSTSPVDTTPGTTPGPPAAPIATVDLVDDSGLLTLSVPAAWSYLDTAGGVDNHVAGVIFPQINAREDSVSADGWTQSGVTYTAFPTHADLSALLAINPRDCAPGPIVPYDDGYFVGVRQDFTNCGSGTAHAVNVAANPSGGRFTAFVSITIARPADEPAIDVILDSFNTTDITPSYELTDATGLITMRAPSWWNAYSVDPRPDSGTGAPLPSLGASAPDDEPGETNVWYQAFDYQPPEAFVDPFSAADRCVRDEGTVPYDDGVFVGVMRTWSNCHGSPAAQEIQVFAAPDERAFTAVVIIKLAAPDQDAVDLILGSFDAAPASPAD